MRRPPLKSAFALGALCLGASVLPSCATNDSMMFIVGALVRKQGACTAKASLDAAILAQGTLDRTFANEYVAALLVGNQITQRGARERLRTETSRVSLKGAEVHLETTQGAELAPAFSSTGTGFVDASSGTSPAVSAMFATLIPASIAPDLPPGIVVAKVRVFGTTLGGTDVESAELAFPIDVCDGCLVSFPASARDLTADADSYQCKISEDTTTSSSSSDADLPCELGIDFSVPCTVCSGTYDACLNPKQYNCYYNPMAPGCPAP